MILGFCFWFIWICKCWGTSFLVYDRVMYSIECYLMLFIRRGVPQALANPRKSTNKSKEYSFKKKISEKAKSVFSVQSVFKFLSIAAGWWTHYSHRYIYSLLSLLCPQPSAGPQIKKWNTDSTDEHGLVFSRIHFLIIFRQWYLDFIFDSVGFASAGALPSWCMTEMYSIEWYLMLFRKRECHKHSRIHWNLKINPITIYQLKKSVKKSNPCSPCNPCLIFCPSP